MKKLLIAALVLLFLVAVGVVGVLPSLNGEADTLVATDLNAVPASGCDGGHDYSECIAVDNTYHKTVCSVCGEPDSRGQVPHTFDRYGHNETEHWMECACGVKKTDVFAGIILPEAHDVDTTVWHTDGENHWNECKCGYRANVEAHNGGTATCLQAAECTVCGEVYGAAGDVHEMEVRWDDITATTHTGIYRCCGLVLDAEEHIWGDDHICDACAYECLHQGGEADCTNRAICDICQKPYGDLIPDAHTGGVATCLEAKKCDRCNEYYGDLDPENHVSTETAYRVNAEDAEMHDLYHVCCGVTVETSAHEEQTAADCQNKAVCALCEAEYGETDDTNHIDGCIIIWAPTGTPKDTHAGAYLICGTPVVEAAHSYNESSVCTVCGYECVEHEGGTATCCTLAACVHCGAGYGDLDASNHESTEFNYAPILNIDSTVAAQHSRTHKCCGAPADPEDHVGGEANCKQGAICTLCGAEYTAKNAENHAEDTFTYEIVPGENDALSTVHKKIHTCCGTFVEEEHVGGEANCEQGAICTLCGAEYTAKNAENHTEDTFTYEIVPGENDALSTVHKKIHTCCGAFVEEEHVGGEANCKQGAICTLCEAEYTAKNAENHTEDTFTYEAVASAFDLISTMHRKIHTCCGAFVEEEHVGGEANCEHGAICTLCEAEYTAKNAENHTEDTFTYEIVPGENDALSAAHKKIHTCCGEFVVEAHVGGEATCQDVALCQYCSAPYGEVDPDAHSWDTDWSFDATLNQHYHACLNDGCTARNDAADCSGGEANCTNKAECEVCGNAYGTVAPDVHVEGEAATCVAQAICQLCAQPYGEVDPDAHSWDTDWSFDATLNQHYHACLNDNCTARNDAADCSGGEANCTNKAECEVCGNAYGTVAPDVHVEGEAATCVAQAICELCAQPYGEPDLEAHNWDTEWSFDAANNKHYHKCLNDTCDARNGEADCNGGEADCVNKAECEVCGNAYGTVSAEHKWATELTDGGDGTHYYLCTVSGCSEKNEITAHDYTASYGKDGDNHWGVCACGATDTANAIAHVYDEIVNTDDAEHWVACICGQEQVGSRAAHDHQITADTVEDGVHWSVCTCGHETERVQHVYNVLDKDAQQHWMKCVCGAIEDATRVDHAWVDGVCSNTDCGYTCLHDAQEGFEFVINPEGGHDKICLTCGKTVEAQIAHDFTTGCYVSDAEYHWVSCICGQKENEEGGVAHITVTPATCTALAVCEICGQYGDVDPENHASTDTVLKEIPGDLRQHAKVHACCQTLIEKENHTYENGVCTGCDYACTHTGGTLTCKDQAVCTVCGQRYGNTAEVAHTYENACDNSCNICGAEREVAAHVYGDWKTTKEATATEKGSKERTCSVCGAKDVAEIAVLVDPNAGNDDEAAAKRKQTTIIIVVAAAAVVVVAAVCIGVVVSKKKKASSADETPAWIRIKNKRKRRKK